MATVTSEGAAARRTRRGSRGGRGARTARSGDDQRPADGDSSRDDRSTDDRSTDDHPTGDHPTGDTPPAGTGHVPDRTPVPGPDGEPSATGTLDVTVVLPCYNERDHVLREVERIDRTMAASGYRWELLVVDDASTDGTLEVLQEAQLRYPRMRLLPLPRNGGSGTARRIGTQQARGEVVVWSDADLTYPNERIPELVELLAKDPTIDQVVGARDSEQGTYRLLRVPAKWLIRKLAERLAGERIPDLNSGLRAFRREVALPYLRLLPPGFSCVTTITMAFLHNQHQVHYVPVEYARRAGRSKFRFGADAYRYLLQVLRMVMYFNPLKVLMPPALLLLGIGSGKVLYDLVAHPVRIATNTVLLILTGLIIASMALLADLIVRSREN